MGNASSLIIVTGWPASGKTTLAAARARELHWPLYAKDVVKEQLFDQLGIGDRAWSGTLSRASYAVCLELARQSLAHGVSCLVEGNLDSERWSACLGEIIKIAGGRAWQIHCQASPIVLTKRFMQRIRHPGHLDSELAAEFAARDAAHFIQTPLPLAIPCFSVNTEQASPSSLAMELLAQMEI
jgi:predicted kinase